MSSNSMPGEVADTAANEASERADNLVTLKFSEAYGNANSAVVSAQGAINSLVSAAVVPFSFSSISADIQFDPGSIDDIERGEIPEKPTDLFKDWNSFIAPVLGQLNELPAFSHLVSSIDEARAAFISRIMDVLEEGATGLDADVEQMIWTRALERLELENIRQYTEAENYFAARGYTLPPGVLAGRLEEINVEIGRKNASISMDISIEQAKLAQINFQFVVEKGAAVVLDMMKTSLAAVIDYNKGVIDKYLGELEAYKTQLSTQISLNENKMKMYVAEIEGYKALNDAANAIIESEIKVEMLKLEAQKAMLEAELKQADLNMDYAERAARLQLEAQKGIAQVYSQIAASALSGINATASYGFSGGASMSNSHNSSYSWDNTKGVETYSNIRHEAV